MGCQNADFIGSQLNQSFPETGSFNWVKTSRRLIKNQDQRVVEQGCCEQEALAHTSGKVFTEFVLLLLKMKLLQQFFNTG